MSGSVLGDAVRLDVVNSQAKQEGGKLKSLPDRPERLSTLVESWGYNGNLEGGSVIRLGEVKVE